LLGGNEDVRGVKRPIEFPGTCSKTSYFYIVSYSNKGYLYL
jgi:hypothetical protein